jgi:thiamine biosynthesis lipoprotein
LPVPVSPILFEATRVALAVADDTGGAFDPTIGRTMQGRGFDRAHRTGTAIDAAADTVGTGYRDVHLDERARTIALARPLTIDLGAVAKGLAIDLAARELRAQWGFVDFAIDAGGDLYLAGHRIDGAPWSVGIRHPRQPDALLDRVTVSDAAVCTSGDYERRSPRDGSTHVLDARTRTPRADIASATVIAPTAIIADALATAAFALGADDGLALLERHELAGLLLTSDLQRFPTTRFCTASVGIA